MLTRSWEGLFMSRSVGISKKGCKEEGCCWTALEGAKPLAVLVSTLGWRVEALIIVQALCQVLVMIGMDSAC